MSKKNRNFQKSLNLSPMQTGAPKSPPVAPTISDTKLRQELEEKVRELSILSKELETARSTLSSYQDRESSLRNLESLRTALDRERDDFDKKVREQVENQLEIRWNQEREKVEVAVVAPAELQAAEIIKTAKCNAVDIISRAEQDADLLRQSAGEEATEIRRQAVHEAEAIKEASRRQCLEHAQIAAEAKQAALDRELSETRQKRKELAQKESELSLKAEELEEEKDDCARRKAWYDDRSKRLGEPRIKELEASNDALRIQVAQLQIDWKNAFDEKTRLENKMRQHGLVSTDELQQDVERLKKENRALRDELTKYPEQRVVQSWQERAAQAETLESQNILLQAQIAEIRSSNQRLALASREFEQLRVENEALRALNDHIRKALQQHTKQLADETELRFPSMSKLDTDASKQELPHGAATQVAFDLADLIEYIRSYAATRETHLYYSLNTIRAFIAGMACSRLLILQGLSGTGKTSLARVVGEALGGISEVIPVQSSWRDQSELLGYNNEFKQRFNETEFTKKLYEASIPTMRDRLWIVVLDEMNLSRIEYYFADFLSVMEQPDQRHWRVPLMSYTPSGPLPRHLDEGRYLRIPRNVWFVGTANRDESTHEITDKVYDRAQVIEFGNTDDHRPFVAQKPKQRHFAPDTLMNALQQAQSTAPPEAAFTDVDERQLERLDRSLQQSFDLAIGNRIKMQMRKFVPAFVGCGGTKSDAIDHQIARKILRRLQEIHDPSLEPSLEAFKDETLKNTHWGSLPASVKVVERVLERISGRKRS